MPEINGSRDEVPVQGNVDPQSDQSEHQGIVGETVSTQAVFFCIGGSSYDIILRTPCMPNRDEKLVVEYAGMAPGGMIANAACAAARLGLNSFWTGRLGDDEGGRLLLRSFEEFGVNCQTTTIDPQVATDFTVILLEPSGERTILVVPTSPSPPELNLVEIKRQIFGDGDTIPAQTPVMAYTMPYSPDWLSPYAELVHQHGGLLALDVEASAPSQDKALIECLRLADLVFCNRGGLKLATGTDDSEIGAQKILDLGSRCVCVTLGGQGAWAFSTNEGVYTPAYRVEAVDTTGAGDCFHAAFAFGYLNGWSLEYSLKFANAAAAHAVQALGARAGYPTRHQVEQFLKSVGYGQQVIPEDRAEQPGPGSVGD